MSEREFQTYLDELCLKLNLSDAQRRAVAGELRDHLDARLNEAGEHDADRATIIREVLAEFGDSTQLATNLTDSQCSKMSQRLRPTRARLAMLGTATAALLAVAVYRGGIYTPSHGTNQNTIDVWINESQTTDTTTPGLYPDATLSISDQFAPPADPANLQLVSADTAHHILVEAVILDAGADTWTSIKQLGDIPTGDDPTIAVLPEEAWPLVRNLPRTTRIAAPNVLIESGKSASILSGERFLDRTPDEQIEAIHDSGIGLDVSAWWGRNDKTIELAVTAHGPRSYHPEDRKPVSRREPLAGFPVVVESVALRAQLNHGQILAHRTPIRFHDPSAVQPHRIVLVRVTHIEREPQQARLNPQPRHPASAPTPTLAALR